jgi:hypothetical protein
MEIPLEEIENSMRELLADAEGIVSVDCEVSVSVHTTANEYRYTHQIHDAEMKLMEKYPDILFGFRVLRVGSERMARGRPPAPEGQGQEE